MDSTAPTVSASGKVKVNVVYAVLILLWLAILPFVLRRTVAAHAYERLMKLADLLDSRSIECDDATGEQRRSFAETVRGYAALMPLRAGAGVPDLDASSVEHHVRDVDLDECDAWALGIVALTIARVEFVGEPWQPGNWGMALGSLLLMPSVEREAHRPVFMLSPEGAASVLRRAELRNEDLQPV